MTWNQDDTDEIMDVACDCDVPDGHEDRCRGYRAYSELTRLTAENGRLREACRKEATGALRMGRMDHLQISFPEVSSELRKVAARLEEAANG